MPSRDMGQDLNVDSFITGSRGLGFYGLRHSRQPGFHCNKEPQGKTHGFESGVYRLVFFASLRDLFRPPRSGTQPPYTRSEFGVCIGA